MTTRLNQLLCSTLFLILINSASTILAASDECPYPCYPPPTGPGGTTTSSTPPPPAATGSIPNSNQPAGYYNPPSGYLPYVAPPPPYGGGGYGTLSPPDPILPYFPYYYRKPPHQVVGDQSSAHPSRLIISSIFLVSLLLSFYIL